MNDINPTLIGDILLKQGFERWFKYMFRIIEQRPFIHEPIHTDLFQVFQDIYDQKTTRQVINICPRSCKTDLCTYFVVYSITVNPRCNWIYSSYSQSLLAQIALRMQGIFEHPAYKAMYPVLSVKETESPLNPLDDWWRAYMTEVNKTNKYTAKKITTYAGGTILFAAAGGQITGFGAGQRNPQGFSGGIILDDFDKPADVLSPVMRDKSHKYISQTLMSRLNDSNVFFGAVAQRLHIDDTSGFLRDTYGFNVLSKPLLNEKGECQIPSQYTPERIKELQKDNYAWQAQYMQEPYMLGGGVFKHEWWRYYQDASDTRYKRIFISADTANKTKEWNDFTAIGVWGLTIQNRLRLLDLVHARLEIPELQQTFITLWEKWRNGINGCRCSAVYIEDKASGTQVIQQLRRKGGIPIVPYTPDKDKVSRALDAVPQVVAGNIELPGSDKHPISAEFFIDIDAFAADGTAKHDDITDCFTAAVREAYTRRGYF